MEGGILAPQRSPDILGSCSVADLHSIWDRSEENSSKLRHTVCIPILGHSANVKSLRHDPFNCRGLSICTEKNLIECSFC